MAFTLTSPNFAAGSPIPARFTCEGEDLAPALEWTDPPAGTQAFTLIMDDPDSDPLWGHWVVYDMPAETRRMPEGIRSVLPPGVGGLHGLTSWGTADYRGPCPPSGVHHYIFYLYALDSALGLAPEASMEQVRLAMKDHVLGEAKLMGTFQR